VALNWGVGFSGLGPRKELVERLGIVLGNREANWNCLGLGFDFGSDRGSETTHDVRLLSDDVYRSRKVSQKPKTTGKRSSAVPKIVAADPESAAGTVTRSDAQVPIPTC